MNPLYKLIGILVAFIALIGAVLGYGHYQYGKGAKATTLTYENALKQQKLDAGKLLAVETEKVRVAQAALQALKDKQEITDANHKTTVNGLSRKLADAGGTIQRLRDPNSARCGGSGDDALIDPPSNPIAGADHPAKAGGLLSKELTGLLDRLTREADDINIAYASCRTDSQAVRSPAN